jgi:hypothetical protein
VSNGDLPFKLNAMTIEHKIPTAVQSPSLGELQNEA